MLNIKREFFILIFLSIFLSENITAQKINQFDENGKRTGIWKKYYNNGSIRYSGQFIGGKEVGTFKFYEQRISTPHIIKEFSSTSDTAIVNFYNHLGKLKTKGKMISKKRVGKWIYFFSSGEKLSEENYDDGELHGLVTNYYRNGKTTNITSYKNGKKNGSCKVYTDDGTLIEEVNYKDGKLNGLAKYYDLKGIIKEKGLYKDDLKIGEWEFYIDGEIAKKQKAR